MKLDLRERELDTLLVSKPENIRYLTGYTGDTGLLIVTDKTQALLTDFRYAEQARAQAKECEVVCVNAGGYAAAAKEFCGEAIGFEGEVMTWKQAQGYFETVGEMRDVSGWLERLRAVKTEEELDRIRTASRIAQQAFAELLEQIRPGMTEREVARELEDRMYRLGAERTSFSTIAVTGKNSSLVHGEPGNDTVQKGDFLLMDFGCVYEGYCSDMTRTVAIGTPSERMCEIYGIVRLAQRTALEGIGSGLPCADADRLARKVIEDAGYGKEFGHTLGHGVGLEIHEQPVLSPKSTATLAPNMAVTVEPGIYLEGEFGVRIEDLVIIGEHGIENLCEATSKDLICL